MLFQEAVNNIDATTKHKINEQVANTYFNKNVIMGIMLGAYGRGGITSTYGIGRYIQQDIEYNEMNGGAYYPNTDLLIFRRAA